MAHFVLVHGACHAGSHFALLTAELVSRGHSAIAPDLPCSDVDAGLHEYARVVLDAMADAPDDVVLVGHSLAALTVPVVATARPVAAIVYLGGIIGVPGRSLADLAEVDADRDQPLGDEDLVMFPDGRFQFSETGAMRTLFHDCAPEVATTALAGLRPQRSMWAEPMPIEDWPATRVHSVVCTDDRIVKRAWSERTSRERLGVEPVLFDSGHDPMLSRPADLAELLISLPLA